MHVEIKCYWERNLKAYNAPRPPAVRDNRHKNYTYKQHWAGEGHNFLILQNFRICNSPPLIIFDLSLSTQSGLDLANRNILWTSVTSAGIKIPLPIDSCCSISLVTKTRADLVSQNCPDLKFTKLATPFSVSVAGAESKPQSSCRFLSCGKIGGGGCGGGRGDNTICTPFFLQTTFAFTQASFTVTPAPSITSSPQ